ncbi:MAG: hypothetical protein ACLQVJ_05210 [Syntrophobacteraceae bacterium]
MEQELVNITLIVGLKFAGDLLSLTLSSHVWVADNTVGTAVARSIWDDRKYKEGNGSLTTFVANASPEASVADMLPTIDEHHPSWQIITVMGAQCTPEIREILGSLGTDSVKEISNGFLAQR